jgi:type IV pilus assembly protein PilM
MLTLTRTRLSPLGLHLGRHSATLVQLSGSAERFELRATAQRRLPSVNDLAPDDADRVVADALRGLIVDHRLSGRKVVSCLSPDELFVETVRLPQLPADEIAKMVPWEAAERLPYPLAEAELRHLMAGEVRQDNVVKQEVILLASHRDVIQRRLRVLERAGLTPIGIDVEPCAWLRCLYRAGRLAETSRMAYLFCGETTSTVMFAEGQRALFLKSFAIGGRSFDEAVAQSLAVELETAASMRADVFAATSLDGDNEVHRSIIESLRPAFDSLVAELELCLRYYKVTFRGRPLEELVLSGSEAAPWLAEYLGERVGVSTRTINPLDCLSRTPSSTSLNQRAGRWATAIGLAMKRLTP